MATASKHPARVSRNCSTRPLTVADVRKVMSPAARNKEAAMVFLKAIGVTFTKNGKVKVRPLVHQ